MIYTIYLSEGAKRLESIVAADLLADAMQEAGQKFEVGCTYEIQIERTAKGPIAELEESCSCTVNNTCAWCTKTYSPEVLNAVKTLARWVETSCEHDWTEFLTVVRDVSDDVSGASVEVADVFVCCSKCEQRVELGEFLNA